MPQASKHTENAELQKTEIDATGIKRYRLQGTIGKSWKAEADKSFPSLFSVKFREFRGQP
jgi:hypothetical protein